MDDKQSLWQPNPQTRIAVLGAGYVGLPVALAFAGQYPTVVCDIDTSKIARLQRGEDPSGEIEAERLKQSALTYCADHREIADASVYIVTVPTPVDAFNYPDLTALKQVSRNLAELLKPGDLVVYESTVFPGATEKVCVPILEDGSKLRCQQDFAVGYSPERINPGDTVHTLERIVKVTSGSCAKSAEFVDQLYRGIITAGTHKAPSIRVAEAAKAIENTQRDVNIALMNELAGMFDALDISTALMCWMRRRRNGIFFDFPPVLLGATASVLIRTI